MTTRQRPQPLRGRPRVSVVVPCYNYGHFLRDCVQGVLDQDGVDVDVLIVDDASPDGSGQVAREIAAGDDRVTLIEHTTNSGHIATFNEGLDAVDGDYVVLLSADDLVTPGSFARSAALLEAHPEVSMVYGFARTFAHTTPPVRLDVKSWTVWSGAQWLERISRNGGNPVATPEVMMPMPAMRKLVGYDARVPHACDFLMWLRASSIGSIGRLNGVDQAYYRVHGDNMHVKQYGGADIDLGQRHLAFDTFFNEDGRDLPNRDELRAAARMAVAHEALLAACACYEQPGAIDVALTERLVAFAEDIYPASRDSRLRRRYDRLHRDGRPAVPGPIGTFTRRVATHVEWRRRRYTGVESAVRMR